MKKLTKADYLIRILWLFLLYLVISIPPVFLMIMGNCEKNIRLELFFGAIALIAYGLIIWWVASYYPKYRRWPVVTMSNGKKALWVLGGLVIGRVLVSLFSWLNEVLAHQGEKANDMQINQIMNGNKISVTFVVISLVFMAPVVEELIFRGLIMNLFFKDERFWWPIILSATLFSACHASTTIYSFLIYFSLGCVLAFIYRKTGNIKLSIGVHFLNNVVGFIPMLLIL